MALKNIEKYLESFDINDFNNLLKYLIKENSHIEMSVLEWVKAYKQDKTVESKEDIDDKLIMQYWDRLEPIVDAFNEYGGGPDMDQENAYGWFERINDLIEDGRISKVTKHKFIDRVFIQYNYNNSGFEDDLMDLCFNICSEKDDWEYLIGKLKERPREWNNELIMDIQKHYLKNDDEYLEMRMKNLKNGMDYKDLADFYISKKDTKKAIEIMEEGMEKSEGRLSELQDYLFDYYARKNDDANVSRVVEMSVIKDSKARDMLYKQFEYYKGKSNYEKAKETLIRYYEANKFRSGYYEGYMKLKDYLSEDDFAFYEPGLIKDAKDKNITEYLKICMEKGMTDIVVNMIKNPPRNAYGFPQISDFDEFAGKLKELYPEDIIEYYMHKAVSHIENGSRSTYKVAAKYLIEVKHIYFNILKDKEEWEKRFTKLKYHYKNRKAFLDEVKQL